MPIAIAGRSSLRAGKPRRQRMSIIVTMRPRKLRMPAISGPASGTGVSRLGIKTSCTRPIGKPNNCSPIIAVTYSVTPLVPSRLASMLLCRLIDIFGLLLERSDQTLTVEFGDIIVKSDLAPALDRVRRDHRRKRNDRNIGGARVAAHLLREFEPAHPRHFDVGENHVEAAAAAQKTQPLLGAAGGHHFIARRLEHGRQHVTEECRVVDPKDAMRAARIA